MVWYTVELYCQHLNIGSMHRMSPRTQSPPAPAPSTSLLALKQKKKQLIDSEKQMVQQIKQYYSDLTLLLHDKQSAALETFSQQLYTALENIDSFCAMSEADRYQHRGEIQRLMDLGVGLGGDAGLRDAVRDSRLDFFGDLGRDMGNSSTFEAKTSKKCNEKQYTIIKQAYLEEITYLQQKIEKLTLKQNKIKSRLSEMESRQKMKKVGNNYLPLPYQEKMTSNLLVERLEAENKILVEQIAESSEKILALRSENSMLMKETQLLPTEKKKGNQSINVIEETLELSHSQERISELEAAVEQLRRQLENQRIAQLARQEEVHTLNERIEGYKVQINELGDYRGRLESQCDSHQSKKMELQGKLDELMVRHAYLTAGYQSRCKENEGLKEMNSNYAKLIKLKDDKVSQAEIMMAQMQLKLKQNEDNSKAVYVENVQKLETKQTTIKMKQLEIDSLKALIKKEQSQKNELKQLLAQRQEQVFNITDKNANLESELAKASKEKQSYAKKEVTKVKKQLKKAQQEQRNAMVEDFKVKYGQFMEKLQAIKMEYRDNLERADRRVKLHESRMETFKEKTTFQMKEMLEKLAKPAQKQKLVAVIESYIENEASLTMKTTQIKMLKEEIATLKKPQAKKQAVKPAAQPEVMAQLQQFEKKLFTQKLELQKQIYQTRLQQQQEQTALALEQKQFQIESLTVKCQGHQKTIKEIKTELSTANSVTNPEISQLRKMNEQMSEREQKLEAQVNGLKNNVSRVMAELQQTREQLKLKKDIIAGHKKQLKDKQQQKAKLNETLTSLLQQCQKLKRGNKQATKKQAIFTEFKQKLISQTELSQQICQLRAQLEDKTKLHKAELTKRDQLIREMKVNQEILGKKVKAMGALEEEVGELKAKVRKFKGEVQRKDTLVEHLKDKQEKASTELVSACQALETELKKTRKQLQIQKSRTDSLKQKQSKLQTNTQLLKLSLIRIYEHLSTRPLPAVTIAKQYNTTTTKPDNLPYRSRYEFTAEKSLEPTIDRYREALSILEISSQDLEINGLGGTQIRRVNQEFSSPSINRPINQGDAGKLSRLLDSEEIDTKAVVEVFRTLLEG